LTADYKKCVFFNKNRNLITTELKSKVVYYDHYNSPIRAQVDCRQPAAAGGGRNMKYNYYYNLGFGGAGFGFRFTLRFSCAATLLGVCVVCGVYFVAFCLFSSPPCFWEDSPRVVVRRSFIAYYYILLRLVVVVA
jgi:hypothetical protein